VVDEAGGWLAALTTFIERPEKAALILVVLAGAWRWLRELFREHKDDEHHDTLMERLLQEDQVLRAENAQLRSEILTLQRRLQEKTDDE